jgi:glyoxylase-like metal-dependent hydrolase (beta-lactamase superfamily II)
MPITRRAAWSTAAAAALTPLALRDAGAAQALSGQQAPGFYRYKIGDIEVTAVHVGHFFVSPDKVAPGIAEDDIKQALAAAALPVERIMWPITSLVLNFGNRLVLIDSGIGDMGGPTLQSWIPNFRAAGFDPANVDTIIVSHFHGDHINGIRLKDGTAMFPKAEIMVPAKEWDFWTADGRETQLPERARRNVANTKRVFGPLGANVTRYDWDKEIVPGVTAIGAPGHTPGHTAFAVTSGNARLLVASDAIGKPQIFARNPDWPAMFDMDGAQGKQTRRRLMEMAASERMQVAMYHADFPATGYFVEDAKRFQMVPVSWQPPA